MLKLLKYSPVVLLAALSLPLVAHADDDFSSHGRWDRGEHHHSLKVALWGDEFYADDPTVQADQATQTIDSMNAHHVDFTVFVGDTKNGHSVCTDQAIGQRVVDTFNRLHAPTMYSLGDNEWTDCHRTSNGAYDPLERLSYLRSVFFDKPTTQGRHPIKVERQGALGQAYSENSRFVKNDVEFVALNVIGSNNNLVVTDHQCFKKSNRSWDDCNAATAEYRARNAADMQWLKDSFALAKREHLAGIVVAIQADVYGGIDLADGAYREAFLPTLDSNNGFSDFFHTLITETQSFDGQVLLVHGDSHYFRIDKAMVDANGQIRPNFTRVEVFGSSDNSWVEMTVDPDSKNVFSFKPVFLQ